VTLSLSQVKHLLVSLLLRRRFLLAHVTMIKHVVIHLQNHITSAFQKLFSGAEGLAKPER